jgi:hypothetical protein
LRPRIRRAIAFTTTLLTAAGVALAGAPSAAADDPATFDLTIGATYFRGTINFFNRSASVVGVLRGLSTSCRRGDAKAFSLNDELDHRSTSLVCNGVTNQTIPLTADVTGGAIKVIVSLKDANGALLRECWAYRGDPVCT